MKFHRCWMLTAFPHTGLFLFRHAVCLPFLLIFVAAIFMWVKVIQAKRKKGKSILNSQFAAVAAVFLLIGGVGTFGFVGATTQLVRFRVLPDEIEALRIWKLAEEGKPPVSEPVIFEDVPAIRDGFARLDNAVSWYSNHECLRDGYRIEIKLRGESGWSGKYLSVYRHSSKNRDVFVVIPHVGKGHWGMVDKAGDYRCPEFWQWIDEVIVPFVENAK